jgi:hypothetical protein
MGEGRELGGSAVSTGAVKATSTFMCVCVRVVADPNSAAFSTVRFSSFSLDKRVRGLSLVIYISFEPLESTRFRAGSFPLRFH